MTVSGRSRKLIALICASFASISIATGAANASEDPFSGDAGGEVRALASSEFTLKTTGFQAGSPDGPFRDVEYNPAEPPCAEFADGSSDGGATSGGAVGSLSVEGAEQLTADHDAGVQDLLDAVVAASPQYRATSPDLKVTDQTRTSEQVPKPVKSPASTNVLVNAVLLQGDPVNVEAVFEIFADLAAEAAAPGSGLTTPSTPTAISEQECVLHYWCGGERVDDVVFGRISDAPEGAYFDYVLGIGNIISATSVTVAPLTTLVVDRDALATGIAEAGFGDQPSADRMPMFYFCRRGEGGELELIEPDYAPSFAWATTIQDQYDVDGARLEAEETLRTLLNANLPQMQTIPPIEKGFAIVQMPMWLWLENINDLQTFKIDAVSEEATVRLSTRATLLDVTWQLGDTNIECKPEDMTPFIQDHDDIRDPTPVCSHKFTKVVDYTMTATARFHVQEQVSYRGSGDFAWPDAPWSDHPTNPYATISNETEPMRVTEILAVNVPFDHATSANPDD